MHARHPYITTSKVDQHGISACLVLLGGFSFLFSVYLPGFVHLIPFLLAAVNSFMAETCIGKDWWKSEPPYEVWMKFDSLPKEYRKSIGVTPEQYYNFTPGQIAAFEKKLDTIIENREQVLLMKGLPDDISSKMDALIQKDDAVLCREREVAREIRQRGW